ncbi:hypothetical protein BKA93DRAFT_754384 [Sparassis latifolia]
MPSNPKKPRTNSGKPTKRNTRSRTVQDTQWNAPKQIVPDSNVPTTAVNANAATASPIATVGTDKPVEAAPANIAPSVVPAGITSFNARDTPVAVPHAHSSNTETQTMAPSTAEKKGDDHAILNDLPAMENPLTEDVSGLAAKDKGKAHETMMTPMSDSDTEFWKDSDGDALANLELTDDTGSQVGNSAPLASIEEVSSTASEQLDNENTSRKRAHESSDSEDEAVMNTPSDDLFFPPPPPPVCVEPDHVVSGNPSTSAHTLQGGTPISRFLAPGSSCTTSLPSFTRLGNPSTSARPATSRPVQTETNHHAAEALAHLDQMACFTPLAPHPGSSSIAALTPTPPSGFPRVYADRPLWFLEDMRSEQSRQWMALLDTALAIIPYGFSASNLAFRPVIMAIVPRIVSQHFEVENPHLVPPLAISNIHYPNQPPFAYLLYNLSLETRAVLLRQYCISSNELTFFVYDLTWQIPSDNASVQVLIDIFGGATSAVADAFAVINSLEVVVLDLHGPGGYPAPAVNLYMDTPTDNLEHWVMWCNYVYRQLFPTNLIGCGQGHTGWHCSGCHASDHPRGLCPFPRLPGWHGPGINDPGMPDDNDNNTPDNGGASSSGPRSNGLPSRGRPAGGRGRGRGHF